MKVIKNEFLPTINGGGGGNPNLPVLPKFAPINPPLKEKKYKTG